MFNSTQKRFDQYEKKELLTPDMEQTAFIATGLVKVEFQTPADLLDIEEYLKLAVASVIRQYDLDSSCYMRVMLFNDAGRVTSTSGLPRVTELRVERIVAEMYNGEPESAYNEEAGLSKVVIKFSCPDPRGGAGNYLKILGKGANALIPVHDHGNHLCVFESISILAIFYDKKEHLSKLLPEKSKITQEDERNLKDIPPETKEILDTWNVVERSNQAKNPKSKTSKLRKELAEELQTQCGLPKNTRVDYDGMKKISDTLTRTREKQCRIQIFDKDMQVIWSDRTEEDRENFPKIDEWFFLLQMPQENNTVHYQPIKSVHSLFAGTKDRYYCPECRMAFQKKHKCVRGCRICNHSELHYSETFDKRNWQRCESCHRSFAGKECFEEHKKTDACNEIWKCLGCTNKFLYPPAVNGVTQTDHRCSHVFCSNCKKWGRKVHSCYVKKLDHDPSKNTEKYLFADFECTQELEKVLPNGKSVYKHVVNFASTCDYDGVKWPNHRNIDEWLDYLLRDKWKGYTIMFHNGRGYDFQFIIEAASKRKLNMDPIVKNGSKIMTFHLSLTKGKSVKNGFRFVDSLNFLAMSLSSFTKTFGLETIKGFFPHLFNTQANQNYEGCIPDLQYFSIESMPPAKAAELTKWHSGLKNSNYVWNFQKEMGRYCSADVKLMWQGCKAFREIVMQLTANSLAAPRDEDGNPIQVDKNLGIDPFQCSTIASCAMKIFRTQHMPENTIAALDKETHNKIRAAMAGGRTGCSKVYWKAENTSDKPELAHSDSDDEDEEDCSADPMSELAHDDGDDEDEKDCSAESMERDDISFGSDEKRASLLCYDTKSKAHYIDFTSLYPYINKYGLYPVGHPESLLQEPCTDKEEISALLSNPGLGIWKVDIKCPQKLYHPLLHEKQDGKLMFTLRQKTEENYTNLELQKAVELGYTVTKVHEILHWEKTTTGIFASYINTFLKLKQEASGWPATCKTLEEKQAYIDEYLREEGVKLDANNISNSKNAGIYSVAKIFLNSLWGKFGQKLDEEYTETKIINAGVTGNKAWYSAKQSKSIVDFDPLNTDSALLTTKKKKTTGTIGDKNMALAVFTTAQARLKLYNDFLEPLGDRVLYYDTDSVIYVTYPGQTNIPLGRFLGQPTNELGPDYEYDHTNYINEMFSGGPKNYGYKTSKAKVTFKCKGLNMNRSDVQKQLSYEKAKRIVLGRESNVTVQFSAIQRHGKFEVDTRVVKKEYRATVTKRRVLEPVINSEGEVVMIDTEPWKETDHTEYQRVVSDLDKKRKRDTDGEETTRKFAKRDSGGNFICYLLQSERDESKTYIGCTSDVLKRLQQHNGLSGGGDVAPLQFRPWKLVATLSGFQDRTEALRYENKAHNCRPGHLEHQPFIQSTVALQRAGIKFMYYADPKVHTLSTSSNLVHFL
jgi:predicted GIY-YIG superfamily endonuclease